MTNEDVSLEQDRDQLIERIMSITLVNVDGYDNGQQTYANMAASIRQYVTTQLTEFVTKWTDEIHDVIILDPDEEEPT